MEPENLSGCAAGSGRSELRGAQLSALISGLARGCFHRRVGSSSALVGVKVMGVGSVYPPR